MSEGGHLPYAASIIIPTYNRGDLLRATLESLCALQLSHGVRVEVLVCDDGSSDDTFAVARSFDDRLDLIYCYQPDRGHRTAAARNLGIRQARGRILIFVDSGVVVSPQFIREHLVAHALGDGGSFVIGPMWGYFGEEQDVLTSLRLDDPDWWQRARADKEHADPRMEVWEAADFRIDGFSAPWSMGWTANVSAPRAAVLAAGCFDERFEGWGGEDVDLAYRLHAYGLTFRVSPDALTVHLPHEDAGGRGDSNYRNKKLIYAKAPSIETELLPAFGTGLYSQRLDEIRAVARAALIPEYTPLLDSDPDLYGLASAKHPRLLLGGGTGELTDLLECVWMGEPDATKVERARRHDPRLDVLHCVGVNTGRESADFGTAIITDYWRAFPRRVTLEIAKEARRIAGRALLFYTPGYEVPRTPEAPVWDIPTLEDVLADGGLKLRKLRSDGPTSIYEIVAKLEERRVKSA